MINNFERTLGDVLYGSTHFPIVPQKKNDMYKYTQRNKYTQKKFNTFLILKCTFVKKDVMATGERINHYIVIEGDGCVVARNKAGSHPLIQN